MLLVELGNHSENQRTKSHVFANQYYRPNEKKPFQMNKNK